MQVVAGTKFIHERSKQFIKMASHTISQEIDRVTFMLDLQIAQPYTQCRQGLIPAYCSKIVAAPITISF